MRLRKHRASVLAASAACAFFLLPMLKPVPARAAGKTYTMKIGMATIHDAQHQWCKWFVASVKKDSGGRINGQCYPASQLGPIPREIEGVQFNEIQGYIGPPEFLVGVDDRYEVLSAPGLVENMEHAKRIVSDPELQKLVFGFGAKKGLRGVALFISAPNWVIARKPIRHLKDFKGLKLRVLSADMQEDMMKRLGATPVSMALGDVLPALQQGTIDGALSSIPIFSTMHYYDASKYVTESGQPFIFSMAFLSKKWFDSLPKDLQEVVSKDAAKAAAKVNPWEITFYHKEQQVWLKNGGELIKFSPKEHAEMMKMLAGVGADVAKRKPNLKHALAVFTAVAKRTR